MRRPDGFVWMAVLALCSAVAVVCPWPAPALAEDPLARIYRESQNTGVRASALRALAKIDTFEAAEMLLGVLQHDSESDRTAAVEALRRSRGMKFTDHARASFPELPDPVKTMVREILHVRGVYI